MCQVLCWVLCIYYYFIPLVTRGSDSNIRKAEIRALTSSVLIWIGPRWFCTRASGTAQILLCRKDLCPTASDLHLAQQSNTWSFSISEQQLRPCGCTLHLHHQRGKPLTSLLSTYLLCVRLAAPLRDTQVSKVCSSPSENTWKSPQFPLWK